MIVFRYIFGLVFYNILFVIMEVSRFCRLVILELKNFRVLLEGLEVLVKVIWLLGVELLLLFIWGCKIKYVYVNINMYKYTDMVMIKYISKICIIF